MLMIFQVSINVTLSFSLCTTWLLDWSVILNHVPGLQDEFWKPFFFFHLTVCGILTLLCCLYIICGIIIDKIMVSEIYTYGN